MVKAAPFSSHAPSSASASSSSQFAALPLSSLAWEIFMAMQLYQRTLTSASSSSSSWSSSPSPLLETLRSVLRFQDGEAMLVPPTSDQPTLQVTRDEHPETMREERKLQNTKKGCGRRDRIDRWMEDSWVGRVASSSFPLVKINFTSSLRSFSSPLFFLFCPLLPLCV